VHAAAASGDAYDDYLRSTAGGSVASRILLASGSYLVTVGASGYASRALTLSVPGEQTVGLTPGGTIVVSSTSPSFAWARLLDETGQPYRIGLGPATGTFRVDPAPGETRIGNVAAGSWTLQLVDDAGRVLHATQVTVREGEIVPAKL
jgi:hypothetical protein